MWNPHPENCSDFDPFKFLERKTSNQKNPTNASRRHIHSPQQKFEAPHRPPQQQGTSKAPPMVLKISTWPKEIPVPETKSSHLKMDGWKRIFLLGRPTCMGYVSFREGNFHHFFFYCQSVFVSNTHRFFYGPACVTNIV